MDEVTKEQVLERWSALPDGCRRKPASDAEVEAFEGQFGPIPEIYRWFLQGCGGGTVGSEWVDDIRELSRTHEKFTAESGAPNGWTMKDVFVIGWDGGGNPFGIHRKNGKVLVEDHQFGGVHEMAPSFEAFLLTGLGG